MTSATSATSEGAQGIFSKITFLKSVRSNEKDEVCHSFVVEIFTKSLHRGGVCNNPGVELKKVKVTKVRLLARNLNNEISIEGFHESCRRNAPLKCIIKNLFVLILTGTTKQHKKFSLK